VQGVFEIHPADVPLYPANGPLKRFEAIEFDPDPLSNGGPFDELNFAALGRRIKDLNSEGMLARPANSHLGIENQAMPRAQIS
jgi:hypothetical protein